MPNDCKKQMRAKFLKELVACFKKANSYRNAKKDEIK